MRILLLGGTGAMGTSLKDILAERGDEVYITSRSRHIDIGSIHYLLGDAHDDEFIENVLRQKWDTIVDFMIYRSGEFTEKVVRFLDSTDQYVFTSSSRVYADSKEPLTEDSPRLLDVCKDEDYLKSDEYALAKAREENVLFQGKQKNWTIIRPYITYNVERLQLGTVEKDLWLYRALHGKSIVLPKDVAVHQTTMTYGGDVATAIAGLIGNEKALGEAFHITGKEHTAWSDVLNIYSNALKAGTGNESKIYMPNNSVNLAGVMGNTTQVVYDRLYDRVFDNTKLIAAIGEMPFITMEDGLSRCLTEFIKHPRWIDYPDPKMEAYLDKKSCAGPDLKEFHGRRKIKYFGWYYIPGIMKLAKRTKTLLHI